MLPNTTLELTANLGSCCRLLKENWKQISAASVLSASFWLVLKQYNSGAFGGGGSGGGKHVHGGGGGSGHGGPGPDSFLQACCPL